MHAGTTDLLELPKKSPLLEQMAPAVNVDIKRLWYGDHLAVRDTLFAVPKNQVTALIGPSGCGKSSVLRCINRMNDLIPGFRLEGSVTIHNQNLYSHAVDPVAVRRHVGMVFQQANPFVTSIYNNVAFGPRINGMKNGLAKRVETALRGAAVWDEVKDKLHASANSLSGGQQQRLCIARAIAIEPEILLLDEPCSALDPIATAKIEDLILSLRRTYTVVIVTHNLQQARRVADHIGFMCVDIESGVRTGSLAEFGTTEQIFEYPTNPKTRDYVMGKFG